MIVNPETKALEWKEVADPVCLKDSILVDIHCSAVNRADLLQRDGKYPSPKGWPSWMGLELSGDILEMGEEAKKNTSFKIGDKVCALVGGGAYAERMAIPYQLVMALPKGLSYEEASAIPEAYATSYLNLFHEGHLKKGDVCYIAAGASGLASAAIPMAKAVGAKVVTSVLNEEIAAKIASLGADYVIVQSKESIPGAFEKLEKEGMPVKVAMDCLSGEDLGKAMPYMAEGGYWVVISTLAGVETKVSLRPLLTKGLHLVGSMLRKRSNDEKHQLLLELQKEMWPHFEMRQIKVNICKTFPIEEAEKAHELLLENKNVGKVVLKIK
mgnify:FL=1